MYYIIPSSTAGTGIGNPTVPYSTISREDSRNEQIIPQLSVTFSASHAARRGT